ncbi:hypothetical protein SLS62_009700 [Diatrype stigma]|uniref:Glycosyl hydrolase family 13 catalytic domain-containing protein n=1 Tax=Diatrype stigma TaxID=117547 RepID=A0AAN9UCB9_9PEZI
MGVTCLWIPPACKAFGGQGSTGYDTYDLYDLGEFDQKGLGVPTKYGTKAELQRLVASAADCGLDVLFDIVVNHKAGADYTEPAKGVRVEEYDRLREITGNLEEIEVWTGFDYPGRKDQYSSFKWNKSHFSGVDYDEISKSRAIWRLEGKEWARDADDDRGNYDYLMFANIDHSNPEVRSELFRWISWLGRQLPLGGIRFDATKHISKAFQRDFVAHIRREAGPGWLVISEYWHLDAGFMARLIEQFDHQMMLFDIPLVHKFRDLSEAPEADVDLRGVFDGSLGRLKPDHSVQEGQTSQTLIQPWFIPLAYALILLHADVGTPCVFYGDLYGSFGPLGSRAAGTLELPPHCALVAKMVLVRRYWAYGPQSTYFDDPRCVGFTRHGKEYPPSSRRSRGRGRRPGSGGGGGGSGLAVVLSAATGASAHHRDHHQDGGRVTKKMYVGVQHAGERWTDILLREPRQSKCEDEKRGEEKEEEEEEVKGGERGEVVLIDDQGWGTFSAGPRSVAVWVDVAAEARDVVDGFEL